MLTENQAKWTSEYAARKGGDTTVPKAAETRYRHTDIKAAIVSDTHDKCAYCESKLGHSQHGDIEHILPKSKRTDLIVTWDNLTLVCRICNAKKSDYYDTSQPLVDPYNDSPETHLGFYGPVPFPHDTRGELTIRKLGLRRVQLIERRQEALEKLVLLLDSWTRAKGDLKEYLAGDVRAASRPPSEFAATIRCFLLAHPVWPSDVTEPQTQP